MAILQNDEEVLRPLATVDVPAVADLYERTIGRTANLERIALHIGQFPSAGIFLKAAVQAFAYTTDFAPDLLELANILVTPALRQRGLGELLVTEIERQATGRFAAMVLVNSMEYASSEIKRPATTFYERLGYRIIASTGPTNLFWKDLTNGDSLDPLVGQR